MAREGPSCLLGMRWDWAVGLRARERRLAPATREDLGVRGTGQPDEHPARPLEPATAHLGGPLVRMPETVQDVAVPLLAPITGSAGFERAGGKAK